MNVRMLLRLSQLDERLTVLDKEQENLPECRALQEAEAKKADLERERQRISAELERANRRNRRLELDLTEVDSKVKQARAKLYDGTVASAKELANLEKKIADLESSSTELEEEAVDGLMRAEELEADLRKIQSELEQQEQALQTLQKTLKEELARREQQKEKLITERERLISSIPSEVLHGYEEIARKRRGPAVAVLADGYCGGCHMPVPTGVEHKVKMGSELQRCENCGRILCPE